MIHRQSIPLSLLTNDPSPPLKRKRGRPSSASSRTADAPNTVVTKQIQIKKEHEEAISGVIQRTASSSTESDEEDDSSASDTTNSYNPSTHAHTTQRRPSALTETGLANYVKVSVSKRGFEEDRIIYEFQCLDCNDKFLTTRELRSHMKFKHNTQTYKCRKCDELFRSIADRQTHKNNKHFDTISCSVEPTNTFDDFKPGSIVSSERNESGYFTCPVTYCTFVTRIPGYWYDHIHHVEHNGENPQKRKKRSIPT